MLPLLVLAGCGSQGVLPPLAADATYPTGIAHDFMAVFESKDGSVTGTTEIVQAGTGVVMRKSTSNGKVACANITGALQCRGGTGTLLESDEAEKALRIEATTAQRLINRRREIPEDKQAAAKQLINSQALFSREAFLGLEEYLDSYSQLYMEACYERRIAGEKETFCFAGDLMPYWSDTTITEIGNITLERTLKAYTPHPNPQTLQAIAKKFGAL